MVKVQHLTPSVYYRESRDFQLFGRIYDILFNYVKNNVNCIGEARKNQMIFKTSDTKLMDTVQSTFKQDKELAKSFIDAQVIIKLGKNPIIKLKDLIKRSYNVSYIRRMW